MVHFLFATYTRVAEKLKAMKLGVASENVLEEVEKTMMCMSYPRMHWITLLATNPMERVMTGNNRDSLAGMLSGDEHALKKKFVKDSGQYH